MENAIVACLQPRASIAASRDEFDALARRFMRQAQAQAAQLTIFPELTGLMLAPALISRFKLGFIKRADEGRQPGAGFLARRVGRVAAATGAALGGGLKGSLTRLLAKNGDLLRDAYLETFGTLAREYGTALVGGSLYVNDDETGSVRNRAYLFDAAGEVVGWQDKLHLAPEEEGLAVPGTQITAFQTKVGRIGLVIGQDVLYPELARLLAIQGADLIVCIAAAADPAQAALYRAALAMRAEENQVFGAASFVLGPSFLDPSNNREYVGQSALVAPIALSAKGDGILVQAGTMRAESAISGELPAQALDRLRTGGPFRPRQAMNLGSGGPVLGAVYQQGISIEQAIEMRLGWPEEPDSAPAPIGSPESAMPAVAEPVEGEGPDLAEAADAPEPSTAELPPAEPTLPPAESARWEGI